MEKMPKILSCDVMGCSYNSNKQCHALAITIGHPAASCDLAHPACDTFTPLAKKGGSGDARAGVGACKEDCCEFNEGLECRAPGIRVGIHSSHADCMTYKSFV
jgi:hypothetical protein